MLKFLPYAGFRTGEVIYVVLDSYMQGLQAALLLKGSQKKKSHHGPKIFMSAK